jgi:uncharacterized protein
MWIGREIEGFMRSEAAVRPAVVLTGARQTGKTSLLSKCFPGHGYVSLDVPTEAERAETSGADFLDRHPAPLIIDEVQYAPSLLRHVKVAIDRSRDDPGQYLITGSQGFGLMRGVTESLAGRAAVLGLHSLSCREILAGRAEDGGSDLVLELMLKGGYPEVWKRNLDPTRFYADYVATYLERDVRSAIQVRSLRDFNRFMRLCATRSGQLVSASAVAASLGVSANTVRAWTSVLEASGVIALVEPYLGNLGKRLVKTPKLYFLDTGLLCYLLGIRSPDELTASSALGPVFETFVYGQLVRRDAFRGLFPRLFFFRDHVGHEVDFVIPVAEKLHAIECKWSQRPVASHPGIEHLRSLIKKENMLSATVITPEPGRRKTGELDTIGVTDTLPGE